MHHRLGASALALVLALAVPAAARPPAESTSAATEGITYIAGQQLSDGGFFTPGQGVAHSGGLADTMVALLSDTGATADTVDLALSNLSARAWATTTRAAHAGRIVMAAAAAGADPRSLGGHDYVAALQSFYSPAGYWESQLYSNALAALGVLAAGERLPAQAVLWITLNQCSDGGFSWMTACLGASDVDTTALLVNVLIKAGVSRDALVLTRARDYLVSAQNAEGGFGSRPAAITNANSTGLVLSAIAALGELPTAAPWQRANGDNPLQRILTLQTPSGGFLWTADSPGGIDNYATVQAVPGVAGQAYPIDPVRPARCAATPGQRRGAPCPRRARPESQPRGAGTAS